MEHPNIEQQERQKIFLDSLPENDREEHARLFRFGNTAYRYHSEAKSQEPSEQDFKEWLEGLPSNIADDMSSKGFDKCRNILSFTRYVMEKNDVGMEAWMKNNLSDEDYNHYINHSKLNVKK